MTIYRNLAIAALCAVTALSWSQTAKVCIDPGHGGSDPGAVGNGQQEKTNVLNTGLKFKAWLDKDTQDSNGGGSWNIVMTRSTDVDVSLQGRCDIANNNNCNRFMSIHNNAASDTSANGTETYSYTAPSTGSDLRDKIQTRMIEAWNRTNRGSKTASFYVLRYTNMPSTLSELAFITNAGDAVYTGGSSWQDVAGKAHMFALQNHYGLAAYTPQTAQSYIVDNGSSGFSASSSWFASTSVSGYYGSNYHARATEAVSDPAQWTANIPTSGSYQVYAWWTAATNRAPSAPYILPNGSTVYVNQQANGGQWNLLGTVSLSAGNQTTRLSCWTTSGYYVIADAIRYYGPN
ncbi:MAG: N-acetylmuramoyl-L-alanine amidase [Candidatus Sumerlaeaceae bacterium]|nr:N-acetylmuramoyl-L-alanine amidase [Candidatus Sumerlaeaceae bacterium]